MARCLPSSLLLALPGVAANAMMTGALLKTIFWTTGPDGEKPFSEWYVAFMSGAILSATDPVAVIGALKVLPDRTVEWSTF